MLGDLYFFFRERKYEEYLCNKDITTDKIQQEEKCDLNAKLPQNTI